MWKKISDSTNLFKFNKDVFILVIPDNSYGELVPVQFGTMSMIDIDTITKEELQKAYDVWKSAHLSVSVWGANKVQQESTQREDLKLEEAKGCMVAAKQIVVPPFNMVEVMGTTRVRGHSKRIHVITELPA